LHQAGSIEIKAVAAPESDRGNREKKRRNRLLLVIRLRWMLVLATVQRSGAEGSLTWDSEEPAWSILTSI
jgi:hypothetical protein